MRRVLLCLPVLLLLTGCGNIPFARELESTMLVQVLGVDWTDGGVTLTAACDPENSEDDCIPVLSASGKDLAEAEANLKGAGEEYVSLTHTTQLVLGEDTDIHAVLEAALEEPALGQTATVWLSEAGDAKDLLEQVDGGAKRLSSIELNAPGVAPVTVLQSLMRLEEKGAVELPLLAVEGGTLVLAGSKLILEEKDGT